MLEALIQMKNGIQSKIPFLRLDVIFFASKKQKDRPLTPSSSESSTLLALTPLRSYPPMVPQVDSSLGGKALLLVVNLYSKTALPSLPYTHEGKRSFIQWLKHYTVNDDDNWLIVGDFNLLRKPEDRNKPGGDVNEMLLFNEAISSLGLIELPLYGRKYTWTNKQPSP